MSRRGFSLLEVLAATVLLAMLAVAMVPLWSRLGTTGVRERRARRAAGLLAAMRGYRIEAALLSGPQPVDTPGVGTPWFLHARPVRGRHEPLGAAPARAAGAGDGFVFRPPARIWARVSIRDGVAPDAPRLAGVLRLLPPPPEPTPEEP